MKLLGLCLLSSLLACSSTRKFAGQQGAPADPYKKDTLDITCATEALPDKKIELVRRPQDYQWLFEGMCPKQGLVSSEEDLTKPINIIVVIETTQSMQASYSAMTKKIFELVRSLQAEHLKVQIAGIGFADEFRKSTVTNFLPAETFANQMQTWNLVDSGDRPLAGQIAISVAIDKFVALAHQAPDQMDARNVILYAADEAIFSSASQSDFGVEALSAKIKKAQINNLHLYYAVPQIAKIAKEGVPDPLVQMQDLVRLSDLNATKLDFPLNEQILNTFAIQKVDVIKTPDEVCAIDTLSYQSSVAASLATVDSRDNVYEEVQKRNPITFKLSPDPTTLVYWLEIGRCCHKDPTAKTPCESTDTIRFRYTFKP